MTKDQVKAVLERVPTWPEDRQQELAEIALEIEAELAGADTRRHRMNWQRLTKGLPGKPRARRKSRRPSPVPAGMRVEYSKRAIADLRQIAAYYARSGNPAIARSIVARIQEVVARITGSPLSGRSVVQRPGVRVVLLGQLSLQNLLQGGRGTPSGSYTSAILPDAHMTKSPTRRRLMPVQEPRRSNG